MGGGLDIHGVCDDRFERVHEAFAKNFSDGLEVGASFALTLEGEPLVDLWAGYRDEAASEPWVEDTIVNVYSTTKTMAALCALVLADRGELDLYAPVAKYWPEFAQNGKQEVEFRHFMSHSAGLAMLSGVESAEDWYDHDKICRLLEKQAPAWKPGSESGYHSLTQGYLIGEVVRRITGSSLGTFFREEIAEPIGADFHIGTDPKHFHRIGEMIPPAQASLTGLTPVTALASRTEGWRRAEIPAANGHGNARSVARVQTMLANGGSAFGHTLLSEAGCARVFDEQTNGRDRLLGVPMRFGMGYGLGNPKRRTCFWGGWGGSMVVCDLDARLCFAYVMNRMEATTLGDVRSQKLTQAVFATLRA